MDWENKEFQTLKKQWYEKIKDIGFKDIEDDKNRIYQYHSTHFRCHHEAWQMDITLTYYNQCDEFYHSYSDWKKYEKEIWFLHCQGHSRRQIVQALKSITPITPTHHHGQLRLFNILQVTLHQSKVQTILTKLKKLMQSKKHIRYDSEMDINSGVTEGMSFGTHQTS